MTKWKPGQSGNLKGRPKGTRDTINKAFIDDLTRDWQEHGLDALQRAREEKPAEYVRMVANILPKEAKMELDVKNETSLAFLEVLKSMGRGDKPPKIIDGDAVVIEPAPVLPKQPKSD
jgi:hypothetical protein